MTIIDLDEGTANWFEMAGGGRVHLRTLSVAEFREIQKKTVKKRVDYKRVDGVPGRFEYEDVNQDLQNELYWDAVIVDWENLTDGKGKEIPCTRENKVLLMSKSKKFLDFIVDSLRRLGEDEEVQKEKEIKNL
jgi:hypothetical protein